MATFDFIVGDDFRQSLESDYDELEQAMESSSWKSVHVLAGSIIEAVLCDYLVSEGYHGETGKDPLKMDLAGLIAACSAERVITDRAVELSNVIRSYRNLIHPGRAARLQERVDANTAQIARSVVEIIADEVSEHRRRTYGPTAEQILTKVERDPSSRAIIKHLLSNAREHELQRLLLDVLPPRYIELATDDFIQADRELNSLQSCFREAFDLAPRHVKEKTTKKFVEILRQESESVVLTYESAFFRASDLEYLEPNDVALVKDHLLSRLQSDTSTPMLRALHGIGPYLTEEDAARFMDPLIKTYFSRGSPDRDLAYHSMGAIRPLKDKVKDPMLQRIDLWVGQYSRLGKKVVAEKLQAIREDLELPF